MELPKLFIWMSFMKEFFTYEQQVEKLKKQGLIIKNEENTIKFLKLEGYYNIINGYAPIFKNNSVFKKGTSFEDICSLYKFDKNLRSIIYKHISSIETHIRALVAHEFTKVHGVDEKSYLSKNSFTANPKSEQAVERLLEECNKTIADALKDNSNKYREYIAHNYKKHNHVPMWVLVRALSFGTVSIFYKNMLPDEKETIAHTFNVSSDQLTNILEVLVSFRNIVAHGERTYCAKLPKTRLSTELSITKKLMIAKNPKGQNKFGRNDFLALLICCKYLLQPEEFNELINELKMAIDELSITLNDSMVGKIRIQMGLQSNAWKNLPKLICDDIQ